MAKAKERRLTEMLNVELAKASAAVSMLSKVGTEEARRHMLEQATEGLDEAQAIMVKIMRAAETI